MSDQATSPHLVLFFTRGVSLATWENAGMFDREIALYRLFAQRGMRVTFITYGVKDGRFSHRIPEIEVRCNSWNLPRRIYELSIPFLHRRILRTAGVCKSNQTDGADIALGAARSCKKPFVARCGYMWSSLAKSRFPGHYGLIDRIASIEKKVFCSADRIILTTERMRDYVVRHYHVQDEKIHTVPNYVLTDLFTPGSNVPAGRTVCYAGRLSDEKNVISLVKACGETGADLLIVGDGSLREELMRTAHQHRVKVHLTGIIPHTKLPQVMRSASLFVLPSFHEGNPKTLLEAMACGLPVIGARSPGIEDIITDGVNGLLCDPDPSSLHEAITGLLDNEPLRRHLGQEGRRYVVKHCCLETVAQQELDLYHFWPQFSVSEGRMNLHAGSRE